MTSPFATLGPALPDAPSDPAPGAPRGPDAGAPSDSTGVGEHRPVGLRERRAPGRLARWRWPLAVAAVVVVAGLAGLALLRPATSGALDPEDPAPTGARAVARVLATHGVDVTVHRAFDDLADDLSRPDPATVVVTRPQRIVGTRAVELADAVEQAGADLVLVAPDARLLVDLRLPLAVREPSADVEPRPPGCQVAAAVRAGEAQAGGRTYTRSVLDEDSDDQVVATCYRTSEGSAYVVVTHPDGRTTTLLGTGAPLTNDRLPDHGNAALAVGTLGGDPRLLWWVPSVTDAGESAQPPSLRSLLPDGVRFAAVQLLVAALVTVLWRGRRLGRLVREPLPVVVRAVEATRGRGQLYRRARARGHAARVLRAAAVRRTAERCGLPRTAAPVEVAAVVADRTGRPSSDVLTLLVGADPPDDSSLVRLARDLDALESEVRHP